MTRYLAITIASLTLASSALAQAFPREKLKSTQKTTDPATASPPPPAAPPPAAAPQPGSAERLPKVQRFPKLDSRGICIEDCGRPGEKGKAVER